MMLQMPGMIEELHVAGLGVIDDAMLEFDPGLNVLTGETGAGKTLITVALSLALGARGGADLLRQGAEALAVEARLRVDGRDPQLSEWSEDGEVVLARSIRRDGRSTARVSGRLAPVATLSTLGRGAVEVHGQHQVEPLLRAPVQLGFLDRFVGEKHLDGLRAFR